MIIKYLSVYKEVDACCMLWQEAIDCMHVLIKRFYFSCLLAQSDNRFLILFLVAVTTAPIRTAKPEVVPRQNNTAPHLRQSMNCVEPGCDKFGDPSMSNRCTEHYRQAMRRPPPPHSSPFLLPFQVEQYNVAEKDRNTAMPLPPEHYNIPVTSTNTGKSPLGGSQYIQAMQKVEGSRKGNKCKSASCDNYGNSSNQGYCNACFKERTSGGNDRVQGNYMCC